ncbi:sensor histidine kinase [Clostridium aminobutyricum]|uniref:histidine kinase n=1 Tax=Clostridium aminobutyricum TaxID=33953 RepID=A0A939IHL4_CLOAM|nr:sensor histidine kinase [Clostridium aminobutyricum]MBN7772121.1 sensor histidine kinase [Clostridium aminobutyricum]
MEIVSNLKLFISWLTDQLKYIGLFVLFAFITLSVGLLSHSDLDPILYSIEICLFLGTIALCSSFLTYRRCYKALYEQYINLDVSINQIPKTNSFIEKSYAELLQELFDRRNSLYDQMRKQEAESTDYYTLWIHQIKTPIAAMRLLLQSREEKFNRLLLEQELFKVEHYAEMALHYFRLNNMSSDLLLKECDLNEIVKQIVKKYSISFIEKRLALNLEEFHALLVSDERWLSFVIEQILSNCIKYTFTGGISIRYEESPEPVLMISDTGIGIQQEDLPRIFEKGFTGFNGRMDKKSTGIGFYLCKQALDKLGYRISVSSEVGKGSQFYLYFDTSYQPYNNERFKEEM